MAIESIQTSTFWVGFYALLQCILWAKIMSVRIPQDPAKQHLRSAAATKDAVWICTTRAYGNLTETAPMMSLLLLVVDAADAFPKSYVHNLGAVYGCARIMHMFGLWSHEGATVGRLAGASASLGSLLAGAYMAMSSAVSQMEGGLEELTTTSGYIGATVVVAVLVAGKVVL